MSVASELERLIDAKAAIRAAIQAQGVTVDESLTLDGYAARIALIEGGEPVDTVPDAFTVGEWTVSATGATGAISINITALPDDGGDAITALQYRIDGGTATALTGTGTGARTITGLTDDVEVDVEVRAVNTVGNGAWSDVKAVTPTVSAGGEATWEDVEPTATSLVAGVGITPNQPAGGTSGQTLVLVITGIEGPQRARLVVPSGWTFRYEYYNLDGFGASSAIGFAVYTAPGNTAAANWGATAGGNIDASWAIHLWSGVDNSAPIREFETEDNNTWGVADNMPSPTATAEEGDGIMAHLYHPQSTTAFGSAPTNYTRVADVEDPGRHSTQVRSNAPAGATGTITHNAGGTYQSRVSFTMVLAAA